MLERQRDVGSPILAITLTNLDVTTFGTPDGKTLLGMTGSAGVSGVQALAQLGLAGAAGRAARSTPVA